MEKTNFGSKHFGAGAFLKMLFSGMILMLLVGVQGLQAQVFDQTQLPAQGAGQTDAESVMSKTFVSTLVNADLAPQADAPALLSAEMKNIDALIDAGNIQQGEFAALNVRVMYWQHLVDELEKGADLYELLLDSVLFLDGLVVQLDPALGVTTEAIYQETLDLLSI